MTRRRRLQGSIRTALEKDNFFLELQDHGIDDQKLVNQQLLRMSKELEIGLVCTNDVHYTYESECGGT